MECLNHGHNITTATNRFELGTFWWCFEKDAVLSSNSSTFKVWAITLIMLFLSIVLFSLTFEMALNLFKWPQNLRLFSHDGKVRILNFNSRCAFWIKIQNTQKRPCVCQITSQNVIWNAHIKSRYRGVFQLRFSQITQQNLCMNDLTSESCFGGQS